MMRMMSLPEIPRGWSIIFPSTPSTCSVNQGMVKRSVLARPMM